MYNNLQLQDRTKHTIRLRLTTEAEGWNGRHWPEMSHEDASRNFYNSKYKEHFNVDYTRHQNGIYLKSKNSKYEIHIDSRHLWFSFSFEIVAHHRAIFFLGSHLAKIFFGPPLWYQNYRALKLSGKIRPINGSGMRAVARPRAEYPPTFQTYDQLDSLQYEENTSRWRNCSPPWNDRVSPPSGNGYKALWRNDRINLKSVRLRIYPA